MKPQWWKPALIFYAKATGWILVPLLCVLALSRLVGFADTPIMLIAGMFVSFGVSVWGILRTARSVKDLF